MFEKSLIIAVVFVMLYFEASQAKPLLSGETLQCYDRQCPSRTTACKKVTKVSSDRKSLQTTITCLDIQDMILKEYNELKDNPFGPNTHYQSTSFSGTYVYGGTNHPDPINVNINNHIDEGVNTNHKYNGLEDFS